MIRHVGLGYTTLAHGCCSPWRFWLKLMNLLIACRPDRCDLSNRCKMIGMIRNVSVDKLHSLDMCGIILVVPPRGAMKGPPPKHNKQSSNTSRLSRGIQNMMNPMTYDTKRQSNKSSRLSGLCTHHLKMMYVATCLGNLSTLWRFCCCSFVKSPTTSAT